MKSPRRHIFHCLPAILLFSCIPLAAQAATCRVTPSGTGNGSDWLQPASLQGALANSSCTTIWVAQGTYMPDEGSGDRNARFNITRNLQLYGGFAGNETRFDERASTDPASTTLSGEIGDASTSDDNSYKLLHIDTNTTPG